MRGATFLRRRVLAGGAVVAAGSRAPRLARNGLLPATFIAFFGYFAWHGGHALNLRYFLPMLPFTSILACYVWREIAGQSGPSPWGIRAGMLVAGALVVAGVIVAPLNGLSIAVLEPVLVALPLLLAGGLLLLLLAHAIAPRQWHNALANASLAGLVVVFVWAATVAFNYDYPRAWAIRAARHALTNEIAALVSPDSVAFVWYATPPARLSPRSRAADLWPVPARVVGRNGREWPSRRPADDSPSRGRGHALRPDRRTILIGRRSR